MEFLIAFAIIFALILLFIGYLCIRTVSFKPYPKEAVEYEEIAVDREKAISNLAEMIRCKTISHSNKALDDEAEFEKFKKVLRSAFPNVFSLSEYKEIGDRAILFKISGLSSESPTVLMSHYDVVSVDEEMWEKPPFLGICESDVLWGRGTLDTKATLNAIMQAAETLLSSGFKPKNDLYFAFAGDEEVNGSGASSIVDVFEQEGIIPGLVLDEGGAVVRNVFPGVNEPCAVIGIAEKGMLNVELSCQSSGGHSSAPKPNSPVVRLSRACINLEKHPFKFRASSAALTMFDSLARHSNFFYRMIFANVSVFKPLLDLIGKKSGGELNALFRTTIAFTQMKGSDGMNVIPPEAKMVTNLRIIPGETVESALDYINKTVNDEKINVTKIYGNNPSVTSSVNCDGYNAVLSAVGGTWQDAIISPYLMVACSDSRHWGRISDKVYRFSAMALSSEERATIHGNNERIPFDTVVKAVEFYIRLIKQC